jgi:hypothetical protein
MPFVRAMFAVLLLAVAAGAQDKTPLQARQEQMRKQFEQSYRGTRQLAGTHRMGDLLRLRNPLRWRKLKRSWRSPSS